MLDGGPGDSARESLEILNITKKIYPCVIFALFIVAFVVHGIANAPSDGDQVRIDPMRGPGGRPLPRRRRSANQVKEAVAVKDFSPRSKLVFRVLQLGVLLTFVFNAVIVILQVLLYRREEWWPGESEVVWRPPP